MTQYARPDSTITQDNWTALVTTLHGDTSDQSDSTYMLGPVGGTDYCELGLSNVTDPQSSVSHIMKVTARADGSGAAEKLTWYLYENTTLRATSAATSISRSAFTTYSYTLTGAEADAISNYSNLSIRVAQTTIGGVEQIDVSEVWFECPDYVAIVTGSAALAGLGGVTAVGLRQTFGVAALAGVGATTAVGLRQVLAAASLAGAGVVIVDGAAISPPVLGSAALTAGGSLTVSALAEVLASAALVGVGSLSGVPVVVVMGQAPMTAFAQVDAAAVLEILAQASLGGGAGLVAVTEPPRVLAQALVQAGIDVSVEGQAFRVAAAYRSFDGIRWVLKQRRE